MEDKKEMLKHSILPKNNFWQNTWTSKARKDDFERKNLYYFADFMVLQVIKCQKNIFGEFLARFLGKGELYETKEF